jgi:CPA2 family monovalent cation:H+ antiporter-2
VDFQSIYLITTLFLVFLSAVVGGITAKWIKLPLLIGYIASGVLFGNLFSSYINPSFLQKIADIGITLLLFTLGLEFSFSRLRRMMHTIFWAASAQIFFLTLICFFLFLWMGFGYLPALYMAVACGLSSTAIVVRVLSERGELDSLPGELATAWAVIQDLAVIPIMLFLPVIARLESSLPVSAGDVLVTLSRTIITSVCALCIIFYLSKRGIPSIVRVTASLESRELFLLIIIGIVFFLALTTYAIGLSASLGAFIAGLVMSETSQNHEVFIEIRPLRDLFAVVIFVSLGMVLPIMQVIGMLPMILCVTIAVLFIKWIVIFGLTRYLGNHRKTAFLVALALMQMGEFGFIIAREGFDAHVLPAKRYIFIVAVTFSTMCTGTVALASGHTLYRWFYRTIEKAFPKLFPVKQENADNHEELPIRDHIVLCGFGRVGKYIGRALDMANIPYLVIDYNQNTISYLRKKGIRAIWGDPTDRDILQYAQLKNARVIIIAIPDLQTQELVISEAQTLNRKIHIICRTHHEEDQSRLKSLGVETIVQPEFEAAVSIVTRILSARGDSPDDISGKVSRLKIEHGLG